MSYRDLRNLCEILRTVGYPRLVSVENFRTPNFPLIADIGHWLVNQYEPKADIPSSCDTESERVLFVRTFAEFMLTKVQVKLNTKRLYQADGYAVKELLKVATVLYNAVRDSAGGSGEPKPVPKSRLPNESDFLRINAQELKATRAQASHLVQKGVVLYDMLSQEASLREARHSALSKAYEHTEVERLLKAAIESGGGEGKKLTSMVESVKNNLGALEGKIEKKSMELDRSQKRLLTLKKVRPAFMDEFEELQKELGVLYAEYVNRFRCLAYLQNQIEDMNRVESERKAEERLNKAEFSRYGAAGEDFLYAGGSKGSAFPMGSSGSASDESSDEIDPLGLNNRGINGGVAATTSGGGRPGPISKPFGGADLGRGAGGGSSSRGFNGAVREGQPVGDQRQLYGSMLGADEESDDDSDMILVDGDNDNSDLGTEDDDEDDELGGGSQGHGSGQQISSKGGKSALIGVHKVAKHGMSNGNGVGYLNGSVPPGPPTTANGGKGYPVDNNNTVTTNKGRPLRPTTGGRTTKLILDDDDDDF